MAEEVDSREGDAMSLEVQKQLTNTISKSDWPPFSGKGEYDHMDFIHWIDSAKRNSRIDDGVIVLKLLSILTGRPVLGSRLWKPSIMEFLEGGNL